MGNQLSQRDKATATYDTLFATNSTLLRQYHAAIEILRRRSQSNHPSYDGKKGY